MYEALQTKLPLCGGQRLDQIAFLRGAPFLSFAGFHSARLIPDRPTAVTLHASEGELSPRLFLQDRAAAFDGDEYSAVDFESGETDRVELDLKFNYDFGIELEELAVASGTSGYWDKAEVGTPLHYGIHLSDEGHTEELVNRLADQFSLVQVTATLSHSNPAIADSRRYIYTIWDARSMLGGSFLKLIERVKL